MTAGVRPSRPSSPEATGLTGGTGERTEWLLGAAEARCLERRVAHAVVHAVGDTVHSLTSVGVRHVPPR